MNKIDKIKKGFIKRKKNNIKKQAIELNDKKSIYKPLMVIMTMYALFMGFAIYAKKDESAILLNSVLKTDFDFATFNSKMNDLLDLRIIKGVNDTIDNQVVNSDITYVEVGEDYYISEGNLAISLEDGLVTYVNGKDDNYVVIVEYNNGVRATYYDLIEVNVFSNDRVYSNDILGSFDNKVKIIFIKDNKKITYEDFIAIN